MVQVNDHLVQPSPARAQPRSKKSPLLTRLVCHLESRGVVFHPPRPRRERLNYERGWGLILPDDFSEYLASADGLDEEKAGRSLWPLRSMKTAVDVLDGTNMITVRLEIPTDFLDPASVLIFGDEIAWTGFYGVRCQQASSPSPPRDFGTIYHFRDNAVHPLAVGIKDFLEHLG